MKRRKLLAALLALTLLLTACGTARETDSQPTQTAETIVPLQETVQTDPTAENKPIASILLASTNGFMARSYFKYLTPTQIAVGSKDGSAVVKGNPIENPGALGMKIADIPDGVFAEICEQLWQMRFDLLPQEIPQPDNMGVEDASNLYMSVCFEDGTVFTSEGYAADFYHEDYDRIWRYLCKQADTLIDQYAVAEKELKEITAVLNYTYNAFSASNGSTGYYFYYYEPDLLITGQTRNTPIDLTNPRKTAHIENQKVTALSGRSFDGLVADLRKLSVDTLPATIEPDPDNIIYDGDTQYIVVYYADGTTLTSQGYCAGEYNEQFAAVWDRLRLLRAKLDTP